MTFSMDNGLIGALQLVKSEIFPFTYVQKKTFPFGEGLKTR